MIAGYPTARRILRRVLVPPNAERVRVQVIPECFAKSESHRLDVGLADDP
jgi:hypothetical protein